MSIASSPAWKALAGHGEVIRATHLRVLMQDGKRSAAMTAEQPRRVRPAAVAGMFYPGDALALRGEVQAMLNLVPPDESAAAPKALIVPHAGGTVNVRRYDET